MASASQFHLGTVESLLVETSSEEILGRYLRLALETALPGRGRIQVNVADHCNPRWSQHHEFQHHFPVLVFERGAGELSPSESEIERAMGGADALLRAHGQEWGERFRLSGKHSGLTDMIRIGYRLLNSSFEGRDIVILSLVTIEIPE